MNKHYSANPVKNPTAIETGDSETNIPFDVSEMKFLARDGRWISFETPLTRIPRGAAEHSHRARAQARQALVKLAAAARELMIVLGEAA